MADGSFSGEARFFSRRREFSKAILPRQMTTFRFFSNFHSRSRKDLQFSISFREGLFFGGAHRTTALMKTRFKDNPSWRDRAVGWLANPALYKARYNQLPEESPVNMRPVRFAP